MNVESFPFYPRTVRQALVVDMASCVLEAAGLGMFLSLFMHVGVGVVIALALLSMAFMALHLAVAKHHGLKSFWMPNGVLSSMAWMMIWRRALRKSKTAPSPRSR